MPAISPFYFTPFFRRCNQFFRKNENIFPGKQEFSRNLIHKTPETAKNRGHKPAQSLIGQKAAQQKGTQVPHPQISAADAEEKVYPAPAEDQQKGKVCRDRQPGPQGPQEAVKDSQAHPQMQSPEETFHCQCRGYQEKKRPSLPRSRGSSKIRAEI